MTAPTLCFELVVIFPVYVLLVRGNMEAKQLPGQEDFMDERGRRRPKRIKQE